jgi:hypothetical protein
MNPTLMQDLAATIAADRRREAERALLVAVASRAATGRRRMLRLRHRATAAPLAPRGLDAAPRA